MYVELHAASAFSFLSAASLPGNPGGPRRVPRLPRAGAARSRRRLRRPPVPQSRPRRRPAPPHRRRAHHHHPRSPDRSTRSPGRSTRSPDHPLTTSPAHQILSARPGVLSRRLAQSLPPDLADEAARAQRRRGAGARRARRLCRWPHRAAGAGAAAGAAVRRGRAARSPGGHLRPRPGLCRGAAPSAAPAGRRQRDAGVPGQRVPCAGGGHRRRAVRVAGGTSAVRRAHLHPRARVAAAGGPPDGGQRRALPEAAGADGPALRRHAAGGVGHARPRRSPAVLDAGSGLSLSALSRAAGRDGKLVSPQDRRRRARAIAIGRITIAPARRSSASWISSPSSSSPATSSSSGTS